MNLRDFFETDEELKFFMVCLLNSKSLGLGF